MQLQFCSGARTVTGSQHLLSVNDYQLRSQGYPEVHVPEPGEVFSL